MPLNLRGLIGWFFEIYYWLLLARVILSLLRFGQQSNPLILQIRKIVYKLTEPLLQPIRNFVNPIQLGAGAYLDLSPLLAMLILNLARSILGRIL